MQERGRGHQHDGLCRFTGVKASLLWATTGRRPTRPRPARAAPGTKMGACTAPDVRLDELALLAIPAELLLLPGTNGLAATAAAELPPPAPPGTNGLAVTAAAPVGARPGGAPGTKAGAFTTRLGSSPGGDAIAAARRRAGRRRRPGEAVDGCAR